MKAYFIVAVVSAWALSVVGAIAFGIDVGVNRQIAKQTEIKEAIDATRHQAQLGAADAISKLKIQHVTVQQRAETIVRERVQYMACSHDDDGLRLVNAALTGGAVPASGFKLPAAHAVDGPKFRSHDAQVD